MTKNEPQPRKPTKKDIAYDVHPAVKDVLDGKADDPGHMRRLINGDGSPSTTSVRCTCSQGGNH